MTVHPPIPNGAQPIAQARQRGLKPAGYVIVSYVGHTPWDAHHVYCESGEKYQWDWSKELPLTIVMAPGIDAGDAIRGCFWPTNSKQLLTLIDIERKQVSFVIELIPKPKLWHRKEVFDYFPETATCN